MHIRLPLPAALRQRAQAEPYFWAYVVSTLFSPPVLWALWVICLALSREARRAETITFAALFVLCICVAPMLYVAWQVRRGAISDMHMRYSHERTVPYAIAIAAGLMLQACLHYFDADLILQLVTLVSIVELTIMLIGTFFIHISLHTMAMSSIISANALIFGLSQSLVFVPLLMLVALARLLLKRHTASQILVGECIGLLTPLAVVAALGQML